MVIIETLRDFGLPMYGVKRQRVARLLIYFLECLERKGVDVYVPPSSHSTDKFGDLIRNTTCLSFQDVSQYRPTEDGVPPPSVQQLYEEIANATENVRILGLKARRKESHQRKKWKAVRTQVWNGHGRHSSQEHEFDTDDSANGHRNARNGECINTAGDNVDGHDKLSLIQAVTDLKNRLDDFKESQARQIKQFENSIRDLSERIADLEALSSSTN